MNSLLIFKEEIQADGRARLNGNRAISAIKNHQLTPNLKLAASLFGAARGSATVVEIKNEEIILDVLFDKPAPARENIELIVAVPRPQTVKKVLLLAASAGLRKVSFVGSILSNKSYLQSKSLLASNIRNEIIKGLEQSFDCNPPEVEIYQSLGKYFDSMGKNHEPALELLADTPLHFENSDAVKLYALLANIKHGFIRLAIGPESGWAESEVSHFKKKGFKAINLGERIFRVEHAFALVLGQIKILREISIKE